MYGLPEGGECVLRVAHRLLREPHVIPGVGKRRIELERAFQGREGLVVAMTLAVGLAGIAGA